MGIEGWLHKRLLKNEKIDYSNVKHLILPQEKEFENIKSDPMVIYLLEKLMKYSKETYYHSLHVATISLLIGKNIGILDCHELYLAALFHDYGKLFISKNILDKPDKLTNVERKIIESHPALGYEYLRRNMNLSEIVLNAILDHHEKFDGSGYGFNKKDKDISIFAKIIAIADVYDAMVTDRIYRKKIDKKIVKEYIRNNSGKQFNKELVKCFIETIEVYENIQNEGLLPPLH